MRWAAPLLLLLMACTAKPQATEPAPANAATAVVEEVHSNLLTVADIHIAAGVDTTQAATLDAINCLRRFLTRKMDPEAPKDYWYAPDDMSRPSGMEDYGGPYAELLYAEFDSVGERLPPHRIGSAIGRGRTTVRSAIKKPKDHRGLLALINPASSAGRAELLAGCVLLPPVHLHGTPGPYTRYHF